MKKSNQTGGSLVELLLSLGILVLVVGGTVTGVINLKQRVNDILVKKASSVQFRNLAYSLLDNPKLFRVNFDPTEASMCAELAQANLPIAWDKGRVGDINSCPLCPGRLGFVIQPHPLATFRGIYVATFRVYHPAETANSQAICNGITIPGVQQFQMIVGLRQ